MFGAMEIVTGISIIIVSIVMGSLIIASGQVFLAIREIALNTRKEESIEEYSILYCVSKINNVFGWILLGVGSLIGSVMIFG